MNLSRKQKKFLQELGPYFGIITMLTVINMMTRGDAGSWWVIWPAMGWGLGIFLKGWRLFVIGEDENKQQTEKRTAAQPVLNSRWQTYLHQAENYRTQIHALQKEPLRSSNQDRLSSLIDQVDDWVHSIERLVGQVHQFELNPLLKEDLDKVPSAIEALQNRLDHETDPQMQQELNRTLQNRQKQLDALTHLEKVTQRAEIQIESTLSSLGTVYSQLLTGQSTNQIADYSRLSHEAEEETRRLDDYLQALDEVQSHN